MIETNSEVHNNMVIKKTTSELIWVIVQQKTEYMHDVKKKLGKLILRVFEIPSI